MIHFVPRCQYQAQTLTLGKVNWCQGGGGGFPLQQQHPGDRCDCLHDCLLHPGGGLLQVVQSEGRKYSQKNMMWICQIAIHPIIKFS